MASFSTEEFMEEIHKYECLYNRYCKEYKDKFKKLNAWKAVSDKFGLEPSTAEAKFKNVRTAYGRWLKKRKNTPSVTSDNFSVLTSSSTSLGFLEKESFLLSKLKPSLNAILLPLLNA